MALGVTVKRRDSRTIEHFRLTAENIFMGFSLLKM